MDNLFTSSAKNLLLIAQKQAQAFHHHAVGTEHLLLAMTIEQEGIAGKTLRQLGVTESLVHDDVETYTGYGALPASATGKDAYLPYSPKGKEVLAGAGDEAKRLGAAKIGTEHILLSLLSDEDTIANRILATSFNLTAKRLRQLVLKKLGVSEAIMKSKPARATKGAPTPTLDGHFAPIVRLNYRFRGQFPAHHRQQSTQLHWQFDVKLLVQLENFDPNFS